MRIDARRGPRLARVAFASLWIAVAPIPAAGVCELPEQWVAGDGSGTGGTGVLGGEDTGTGPGGEGSGTGGTGFSGDASSGTGILGTVTGFGSVCVNGLRVGYDESTPIERDGRAVAARELAVGHVVRVTTGGERPLQAERIVMEHALSGPVTRVDAARYRVWVMEQPVELARDASLFDHATGRATDLGHIEPGARLDVSGLRRGDGVVVASRLEHRESSEPHSATGILVSVSRDTFYLGDLRAKLPLEAGERVGDRRVSIRGHWNAETDTFEASIAEAASPFSAGIEQLSLQGFVEPGAEGEHFRVAGTPVDASQLSEHERAPDVGAMIHVSGRVDRDGRLQADRIRVQRRAADDGRNASDAGHRHDGDPSAKEHSDRGEREERADRSGSERSDRPERSERPERPERSDRSGSD